MGRPAPTSDKTNLSSIAAAALILAFVFWVASFAERAQPLYARTSVAAPTATLAASAPPRGDAT